MEYLDNLNKLDFNSLDLEMMDYAKNDNVPIIEQNLIIHHKRNLRKSLAHKPKQYFDNEQKQKEPKENLNKNNNEINKNEAIINTGKRLIKFDNNLLIKKEDLLDEN